MRVKYGCNKAKNRSCHARTKISGQAILKRGLFVPVRRDPEKPCLKRPMYFCMGPKDEHNADRFYAELAEQLFDLVVIHFRPAGQTWGVVNRQSAGRRAGRLLSPGH